MKARKCKPWMLPPKSDERFDGVQAAPGHEAGGIVMMMNTMALLNDVAHIVAQQATGAGRRVHTDGNRTYDFD